MKIGVISDTHIRCGSNKVLPEIIWSAFSDVDLILHAGDINDEEVLVELEALAPVEVVAGNTDSYDIVIKFGEKKILTIEGKKIGLTHGAGYRGSTPERAKAAFMDDNLDCVVFGHSHQPYNKMENGILMFNPGSCMDPRREPQPSYGILYATKEDIKGEIFYFDRKK